MITRIPWIQAYNTFQMGHEYIWGTSGQSQEISVVCLKTHIKKTILHDLHLYCTLFYGMTNRCNNVQWFYFSASPLYMFRVVHTPIIRSTGLTVFTVIGTIIGPYQATLGGSTQDDLSLTNNCTNDCRYS